VLADAGASALLPQSALTSGSLGELVSSLLHDRTRRDAMAARALARGRPQAAADIVSRLLTLAGQPGL
jgi:UDP-N-acetylglucosamine:LPS N-acetylglucosamine transferase